MCFWCPNERHCNRSALGSDPASPGDEVQVTASISKLSYQVQLAVASIQTLPLYRPSVRSRGRPRGSSIGNNSKKKSAPLSKDCEKGKGVAKMIDKDGHTMRTNTDGSTACEKRKAESDCSRDGPIDSEDLMAFLDPITTVPPFEASQLHRGFDLTSDQLHDDCNSMSMSCSDVSLCDAEILVNIAGELPDFFMTTMGEENNSDKTSGKNEHHDGLASASSPTLPCTPLYDQPKDNQTPVTAEYPDDAPPDPMRQQVFMPPSNQSVGSHDSMDQAWFHGHPNAAVDYDERHQKTVFQCHGCGGETSCCTLHCSRQCPPQYPHQYQLECRRRPARVLSNRERLLLFVRVIFRYLDVKKGCDPLLRRKAEAIVRYCTRRSRRNNLCVVASAPVAAGVRGGERTGHTTAADQKRFEEDLRTNVMIGLQNVIPPEDWAMAEQCFHSYCLRRGLLVE